MTVRQWSDTCFAAYVGVTSEPFSGTFVGTGSTRAAAQALVCNDTRAPSVVDGSRPWDNEAARDVNPVPGQPAHRERVQRSDRRTRPQPTVTHDWSRIHDGT